MRRTLLASMLLAVTVAMAWAGQGDRVATGKGTIRFGHNNNGVLMFDFNVDGTGARPTGSILCAAEDHGALYPDIIIRVDEIQTMQFQGRTLKIRALGRVHDEPVSIAITGHDGEGTTHADRFSILTVPIEADDGKDHAHFAASGELWSGDIAIGTAE